MRKVRYREWEHICLDTTIIFAYLQALRENNKDERCVFVKKLIDDLVSKKSSAGKSRQFYISAISISEMYDRSDDTRKTDKIVTQMNVSNMTYVSFDTDIAEFMTSRYHPVLGTEKLKALTKEISWPENDMVLAKEWITKDLMIIATADYLQCDTILTLDKKTFAPVSKKVDYFCCVAIPENFRYNDTYIFDYTETL